jgi:hypothetical protein
MHAWLCCQATDLCLYLAIRKGLADVRLKRALWRYHNNIRPRSPVGDKTPAQASRRLGQALTGNNQHISPPYE